MNNLPSVGGPQDYPTSFSGGASSHQYSSNFAATNIPGLNTLPPAPNKMLGELKLWTGTWNMGAVDPFLDERVRADPILQSQMLEKFVPRGYDVYVLGVQEGISDEIFSAVERHTETFRLPLHRKLYPSRDGGKVKSRRMGHAINVSHLIEEADQGIVPDPVASTIDMLDRVWGRGDGAMLTPKFTGIAVFVSRISSQYIRLLGMYKHSFGASEGSKGGVGVALGIYNVTIAFINTHMASKRPDMRRSQYQELVNRLGGKLGGRGFGLNESFHHVIWMGDLNTHCKDISAANAISLIKSGRHMQLLLQHDELLIDKEGQQSFFEYEEPLMAPNFLPTYKRIVDRVPLDNSDPDWINKQYQTAYKEPFYKGGRIVERCPAWTDRIQYHSLSDRWGELFPEPLDPSRPDESLHNYQTVNNALLTSDHSPVFATFGLQICAEEISEVVNRYVAHEQLQLGYLQAGQEVVSHQLPPVGPVTGFDFSSLHPSLRPVQLDLNLYAIMLEYGGNLIAPRAVSAIFPLPFEDSNDIPDRTKVARESGFGALFSRQVDALGLSLRTVVSRASKLESLHLLLKISLDDNTKGQVTVCMKSGGFVTVGSHMNTFLLPLNVNGLPYRINGEDVKVHFTMEMNCFERGGVQGTIPTATGQTNGSSSNQTGQPSLGSAEVVGQHHQPQGLKRNDLSVPASASNVNASANNVQYGLGSTSSSLAVPPTSYSTLSGGSQIPSIHSNNIYSNNFANNSNSASNAHANINVPSALGNINNTNSNNVGNAYNHYGDNNYGLVSSNSVNNYGTPSYNHSAPTPVNNYGSHSSNVSVAGNRAGTVRPASTVAGGSAASVGTMTPSVAATPSGAMTPATEASRQKQLQNLAANRAKAIIARTNQAEGI